MKPISQLAPDFRKVQTQYEQFEQNKARIVGIEAVKDVKLNFQQQKFGGSGSKWKERTEATNKTYDRRGSLKGSVYNSKSPLLVQTGNMRDSIDWHKVGKNLVFIGLDLGRFPGAKLLNEGGEGKMYGHSTSFPERKFLGWTPRMKKAIITRLKAEHDRIFRIYK